jgi:hypothetical protein
MRYVRKFKAVGRPHVERQRLYKATSREGRAGASGTGCPPVAPAGRTGFEHSRSRAVGDLVSALGLGHHDSRVHDADTHTMRCAPKKGLLRKSLPHLLTQFTPAGIKSLPHLLTQFTPAGISSQRPSLSSMRVPVACTAFTMSKMRSERSTGT